MSSIFWFAFHAVTPMLLLMLLGWGLQAKGVFDENMLHKMNGFTFRFGLSAMMFCNTYGLTSLADFRLNVMACVLFAALVLTGIGWAEGRLFTRQRNRRGIMMQNAFRSNFAIIGTTLAISVGGVAGGAAAASIQAPAIIYFNVASVVCLSIYSDRPGQTACLADIERHHNQSDDLWPIGGRSLLSCSRVYSQGRSGGTGIFPGERPSLSL